MNEGPKKKEWMKKGSTQELSNVVKGNKSEHCGEWIEGTGMRKEVEFFPTLEVEQMMKECYSLFIHSIPHFCSSISYRYIV